MSNDKVNDARLVVVRDQIRLAREERDAAVSKAEHEFAHCSDRSAHWKKKADAAFERAGRLRDKYEKRLEALAVKEAELLGTTERQAEVVND